MMASKKIDPKKVPQSVIAKRFAQRLGDKAKTLKYYSPEIHTACMALPKIWQL
jgi:spermidine synthase